MGTTVSAPNVPADRSRARPSGWDRARLASESVALPPLSSVNRLLSVPEVAAYLGVGQRVVWQEISVERAKPGRGLPFVAVGKRSTRVAPADLRSYVERRRSRKDTAPP